MAQTALVTGASGGIGLEFAEQLAKAGYQVTLVARGEAKLKEHVARLGAGQVVEAALSALESRSSPTILTSFANKAMVFVSTRMIPRKTMVNMMGGQSPKAPAQLKP